MNDTTGNTISDSLFTHNNLGVVLQGSGSNMVEGCSFENGYGDIGGCEGIHLLDSSENTIDNCSFRMIYGDGIYIEQTSAGRAGSNDIRSCQASEVVNGIIVKGGAGSKITACTVRTSDHGIKLLYASSSTVAGCLLAGNTQGMLVEESPNAVVRDCNISQSEKAGLQVTNSDGCKVFNCTFQRNYGWGVSIDSWFARPQFSSGCQMTWNRFLGNNHGLAQAQDFGNENAWDRNHWSDWTSPDLDKDGYVDLPYNITSNKTVKDRHPLAKDPLAPGGTAPPDQPEPVDEGERPNMGPKAVVESVFFVAVILASLCLMAWFLMRKKEAEGEEKPVNGRNAPAKGAVKWGACKKTGRKGKGDRP
jgi:parallel beta-helix repeat protein